MFWRLFLQLMLICTFVACGGSDKKSSSKKTRLTPEMMEAVMAQQNLSCPEGDCPEGVGRMFAINFSDADKSSMCTAFLVSPDTVMTNTHCVYAGGLGLEKTCTGLYFTFKSGGGAIYNARCGKILWRDPKQRGDGYFREGQKDFALVRLDAALPLQPLDVDRQGLQEWKKAYPLVVDHIDAVNARIVKLNCDVYYMEKGGYARMGNCPAISGNSGSPVVDETGRVVGVLFASQNPNAKTPTTPIASRKDSSNVAYAFSMSYIDQIIGHLF